MEVDHNNVRNGNRHTLNIRVTVPEHRLEEFTNVFPVAMLDFMMQEDHTSFNIPPVLQVLKSTTFVLGSITMAV